MGGVHDKILVGEAPEPEVNVWSQITHSQKIPDECMEWFMSINADGRSSAEIRKVKDGFQVWARRKK